MKWISIASVILLCACQFKQTESTKTSPKTSRNLNQHIKSLELNSHQKGHVQWKLKAQEIRSKDFKHSYLTNLSWAAQSSPLKLNMEKAEQLDRQIFASDEGKFSSGSFELIGAKMTLNLQTNRLIGQSAKLSHPQVEFEFSAFNIDLANQQLQANKVHAILRSYP